MFYVCSHFWFSDKCIYTQSSPQFPDGTWLSTSNTYQYPASIGISTNCKHGMNCHNLDIALIYDICVYVERYMLYVYIYIYIYMLFFNYYSEVLSLFNCIRIGSFRGVVTSKMLYQFNLLTRSLTTSHNLSIDSNSCTLSKGWVFPACPFWSL